MRIRGVADRAGAPWVAVRTRWRHPEKFAMVLPSRSRRPIAFCVMC